MEGVVGEVVLHGLVAQLSAYQEEGGGGAGRFGRLLWLCRRVHQPSVGRERFVSFDDVDEAHVVGGGSAAPADVDVVWSEEVVEDHQA